MKAFRVRIQYREPSYELANGNGKRVYSGTFDVVAETDAKARDQALHEFRQVAAASSVGWVREVERVLVELRTD